MQHDILTPISVEYVHRLLPLSTITVPAGFPSPAADHEEEVVDPVAWIVQHESATFWWRVSGDSLENEGIRSGDLIAVDRAGKARPGRIVVAVHEGSVTVKMIEKIDGKYWLMPRSKCSDYKPILMTSETQIWGVVAGVCRRYPVE